MSRVLGSVVALQPKRGFGMIRPHGGGEPMFLHCSQIVSEDKWPQVMVGNEVEYTVGHSDRGKQGAMNITLPGGLPIKARDPVVTSRVLSDFTVIGEVAEFKREIGTGVLVCDIELPWPEKLVPGSFIFVSREDLEMAEGSPCRLEKGMAVEFRVFMSDKGVQAAEVTDIGGIPLYIPPPKVNSKGGGGTVFWDGLPQGKSKAKSSWDIAGDGCGVQKTIQKSPVGTERALLEAGGAGLPSKMSASPLAGIAETASMDLIMDEDFQRAKPEEQAAALGIMEQAIQQAAMAQAAMEQAQALVRNMGGGSEDPHAALARLIAKVPSLSQMQPSGAVQSKAPCRYFAGGCCHRGNNCPFSHDPEMFKPKALLEKIPEACSFYDQGRCSRGASCPFAHGPEELLTIQVIKGKAGKGRMSLT